MSAGDRFREGTQLAATYRYEEARIALEAAVAQGAGASALGLLAAVRAELGDSAGAQRDFEAAAALEPDNPALALADASFLPMVYRDNADLERWRQRYTQKLDAFVGDIARYVPHAAYVQGLIRTNFLLAYQGQDDRQLQQRLGEGLDILLRRCLPRFFEPLAPPRRSRPRIGFASAYFHDCTAGRYFGNWLAGLDPARFEVVAFSLGAARDAFAERLASSCARFDGVDLPVARVAAGIREAELDVLVYPEVGMDPRTRLLACLRLAPVQLAAWGHPETTGSRQIDGFLGCAEMETAEGPSHYTESLLALPGLGVSYEAPEVPAPFSRTELRLEGDHHLYFCPHSLFKLHPDSDALFADILAADPRGVLVVFQAQAATAEPARLFGARVANALAQRGIAPGRQVRVLPRLSPHDFRRALQVADVIVDPLHWSGGNTALDALAAGVPVVTTPGPLMRSRQAAAMLRRLEVPELIAASAPDAARIALQVAQDASLRQSLSQKIVGNRGALFGDAAPLVALAAHLKRLAAG